MKIRVWLISLMALFSTLLFACTLNNPQSTAVPPVQPTTVPPVVQLMPNLHGHQVIEGREIKDYIAGLAEGAALLSGHPELAPLIAKVDSVITCYHGAGAVNARIYSDEAFPLSSGAIAIADRNRLSDPATLFRCVGGRILPLSAKPSLNPCAFSYTLGRDDNEFYIIYAGTTQEICHTFCVNLEGCSGH